jgi:hypothetical protein
LTTLLYIITYVPYMMITRALATQPNAELGRPLSGLEILPATLIISTVMLILFVWWSGWWRSAHRVRVGRFELPWPTKWTLIAGVGTSLLLFTVPLSLTFEGVSIPFIQLVMRGDVLVIAPLVDLLSGRKVRWYSWVALGLVSIALGLTLWERGGLHMPPLALFAIVLYTIGYFMRLSVMTRIAKNGNDDSSKAYFVEEKLVAMPLSILGLALVTMSPLASQGSQITWGFIDVWSSNVLPLLALLALIFTAIAVFAALILLDPRENTYCVPFERAASILAGTISAFLLALMFDLPAPTGMELVGMVLLIAAIALLSIAPSWGSKKGIAPTTTVETLASREQAR